MRTASGLAIILAATACGKSVPLTSGGIGGGGSISGGGGLDGGSLVDAGSTEDCPDTDGTKADTAIVISQIGFGSDSFLEVYNTAGVAHDLSSYGIAGSLTSFPSGPVAAGGRLPFGEEGLSSTGGELALTDLDAGVMVQYVCWGDQGPTALQTEAYDMGLWYTDEVCVASPPADQSLHLAGAGTSSADWEAGEATRNGCPFDGGQ